MKLMKRTLCMALALVMLIGMFTVGASAAGTANVTVTVTDQDGNPVNATITVIERTWSGEANNFIDTVTPLAVGIATNGTYTTSVPVVGDRIKVQVDAEGYESALADAVNGVGSTNKEHDINGTKNVEFTCVLEAADITPELPPVVLKKHTVTFYNGSEVFEVQKVEEGGKATVPATEPTMEGFVFNGWTYKDSINSAFDPTKEITGDVDVYASWKEKEEEVVPPTVVPSTPIVPAVPNGIYGKYIGAVKVVCGSDHHDSKTYPFNISKADQVTMVTATKAVVYLTDSDISTIVASYNSDTHAKHTFTSEIAVALTLEYKPGFWMIPGKWDVTGVAELPVTCDCDHCHDWCGGLWHKHTIKYTDGVKNEVVFKDVVKTVKHGAKTPTIADPVRKGYIFTGWSPKVASKATKCVVYTATWKPADAPALTKEHVAYLQGYGKGLVKPEGEITRAEAITMLYRLMDSASAKKWYTPYNNFTDVAKDAWYNDAVSTLANAGVLRYTSGLLNPNEKITRAEFFYMLTGFTNASYTGKCTFTDVALTHWAYDELALAQYLGWIKGYGGGVVYPDDTISRAEVAAVLNRVLDRDNCKTKDTKNFADNPVNAWYYQDIVEASISH